MRCWPNAIRFDRLGLLIIDEEQRFGVKHKERLKELKADVHVLTLSATPIPRTLQLALTGVRELSLITTAPVDRLAVRTFISPFDALTVREALLRERYRGGQSFYVCPRVSDLADRKEFLETHVPELKVAVAHGQMPPGELDDIMNAFYDGQYDVLLSTTIVESGLDIPTANTLIVHRADMFGLAQLYQLRGRVGRSKTRAYALFTLPVRQTVTANAERRLKVLQSLESIGAGFELASHDLDIRGSGNLLGEEQSGHIKEVGYELYQQMLEEAVAELRHGEAEVVDHEWSPQIAVGTPVLIPEEYVPDLSVRLGLYRRLASLRDPQEIDSFGAELIDRFGPLPTEVDHLLKIVYVKGLCLRANVEKLDAGPKGCVIAFRNRNFANPAALIRWIGEQPSLAKIRPDQSLVLAARLGNAGEAPQGRRRHHDQAGGHGEGGLGLAGHRRAALFRNDLPQRVCNDFRRLRACYRIFVVDDEAGYAGYAHLLRVGNLALDILPVGIAFQKLAHEILVKADFACRAGQDLVIADICALLEIQFEEAVHQGFLRLRARAARPADQPVRIQRVWRNLDGIERKVDASAAARF